MVVRQWLNLRCDMIALPCLVRTCVDLRFLFMMGRHGTDMNHLLCHKPVVKDSQVVKFQSRFSGKAKCAPVTKS